MNTLFPPFFRAVMLGCLLLAVSGLRAGPASKLPFDLQQPDGAVFEARVVGDEYFGWYETVAGYPIHQDVASGEWRYLDPAARSLLPEHALALRADGPPPEGGPWTPEDTAAPPPEAEPGMAADMAAAEAEEDAPPSPFGEGRLAVMCARFADMAAQPVTPVQTFYDNLFVKTLNGQTTLRDYFGKVSYGDFDLTAGPHGVMGWYTVSNARAYYGAPDPANPQIKDVKAKDFVQEVVQMADATMNFGAYDMNNDGYVDCAALIAQGLPQDGSGGPNAIWSHQGYIPRYLTNDVNAEGEPVYVSRYFLVSEQVLVRKDDSATPANERLVLPQSIGVIAHEYGHALGLPDLYDRTDGTGSKASEGLGGWSLMAAGSWNSSGGVPGDSPAWPDAWCRKKLGWANMVNITTNTMNVRIPDVQTDRTVYRLWTNGNLGPQYFLIENRYASGFDLGLPERTSGLLIYHVDDAVTTQNDNEWYYPSGSSPRRTINGHYKVALEQADGLFNLDRTKFKKTGSASNQGDKGDVWKKGQTFDTNSVPSSREYNTPPASGEGDPSYVQVRNIRDPDISDRSITADLIVSSNEFATTTITLPAEPVGGVIPVYQTMPQIEGTAHDDDAWGTGVWEVQVYLKEDKPDGRYWHFNSQAWQSSYSEALQKGVATGTGGLNWARLMNDAALSDGIYEVKARSRDAAGLLGTFVTRKFRIQRDMTAPEATVNFLGDTPLSAVPTMTGTATDAGGIQEKRFCLYSHTQGKWLKWTPAPGALDSGTFNAADHILPQTNSTSPWTVTLPPLLPNGDYQFFVEAVDTTNQSSGWQHGYFTLQVSPKVALTGSLHGSYRSTAPPITGTAEPGAGATLVSNRVTLVIQRGGQWWDGDSWEDSYREVHADVSGGTWTYPVTSSDAVAQTPTGDGGYTVTVSATDSLGRVSMPVLPGLAGNTAVSFILDTVPPVLEIVSPAVTPALVITGPPPLPPASTFIHGTADDSSGRPAVTLHLKRLADGKYWSGVNWFTDPDQADIPGSFGGEDLGSRSDWVCATRLPRLGIREGSLKNGTYEVTAYARDLAGNESVATTTFTVNWNPVWLRPQDALAQFQPEQTPPLAAGTVGSSVHQTYSPRSGPEDNIRTIAPSTFGLDAAGNSYVISAVTNASYYSAIFQRLGAGGWRRERLVTYTPGANPFVDPPTYYESWDGVTSNVIPLEQGNANSSYPIGRVDPAGNIYAAYHLSHTNGVTLTPYGTLVVKFDPTGNLLWRSFLERPASIRQLLPTPDGGAYLVLQHAYLQSIEYGFSMQEVVKISSSGSFGPIVVHGQLDGGDYDPAVWVTHLFSEVDPAGNLFFATSEDTIGGTGPLQVLRKHNAAGAELAKLEVDPGETPEQWLTMKTDAAGDLYVASVFDVSETDRRICLTRYNASLQLQWRAFGPPNSMPYNPNASWTPQMHIGTHGITLSYGSPGQGFYSEFPYEHGQFARFSASGDLLWTRGVKGSQPTVQHGDSIFSFQVDNAGNVLFLAAFNEPSSINVFHYGKLTSSGDLQFIRDTGGLAGFFPIDTTVLYQGTQLLALDQGFNNALPPDDTYDLVLFDNPANQLVPVTLDADSPTDLLVIEGASSQLRVINRGSAATAYQWRKKDGLGVPQNIPGATLDRLFLNNITPAEAGEYSAVVTNAVDNATSRTATVTVLPPVALDVALDTPGRTWTTGGSKPWVGFASTTLAHDTVDAAMPTTLARGETSWLETTVTGPVTVSYRWKSANPTFSDFYQFTINGDPAGFINGDHDWTLVQHNLGAGTHTLRWSFNKSTEVTGGSVNTVYLDQIAFTTMPDIVVELDPGENLLDGLSDIEFLTALPGGNRVNNFTIRNNGSAQLNSLVINKNGLHAGLFTVSPLSSTTVEPGDTATFSITFAPDTAGTKYASIQITSNDTDESPFDIDLRGTGGVPITSWRQTHFGTTANTGNAADDADADGDGVLNLLEFATLGTPGTSDKGPGEMAPLDSSGSIYFTYTRNKQAMAEVTFQVEWADDLSGPWSPSGVVENIVSDNGLIQTVTATLPAGTEGHRFVRLRVSR